MINQMRQTEADWTSLHKEEDLGTNVCLATWPWDKLRSIRQFHLLCFHLEGGGGGMFFFKGGEETCAESSNYKLQWQLKEYKLCFLT